MMTMEFPIAVGDRIYYENYCVKKGFSLPDYLLVTDVKPMKENPNMRFITAHYERHTVGTSDRVLSSNILLDPNWKIVKKGQKS